MYSLSHTNPIAFIYYFTSSLSRHATFLYCSLLTIHSNCWLFIIFSVEIYMWIFCKYSWSNFVHFHLSGQFFFCHSSPFRTFINESNICSVLYHFLFHSRKWLFVTMFEWSEHTENEEWEEVEKEIKKKKNKNTATTKKYTTSQIHNNK